MSRLEPGHISVSIISSSMFLYSSSYLVNYERLGICLLLSVLTLNYDQNNICEDKFFIISESVSPTDVSFKILLLKVSILIHPTSIRKRNNSCGIGIIFVDICTCAFDKPRVAAISSLSAGDRYF